jgi:hypothetical protein
LDLDFLTTKTMMIQLIDAMAQNEAKLRSPIRINIFHLVASENCPNMEIGTAIPTKIDRTNVALKDPKELSPLLTLHLPFIPPWLSSSSRVRSILLGSHMKIKK